MTDTLKPITISSVAYPLGFIFSPVRVRFIPPNYVVRVPGLPLFTHPRTRVASAGAHRKPRVILIGLAIHEHRSDLSEQEIAAELLARLDKGQRSFLEFVDGLVGRYAILFRGRDLRWRILNDAIGTRSVYYAREHGRTYAASHAQMVFRQLDRPRYRPPIEIRWGYPGLQTPFEQVYLLAPNNWLEFGTGNQIRFFPTESLPQQSPSQAAEYCISVGTNVLKSLVRDNHVLISLTAGLDSRVTLALGLEVSDEERLKYFTYNTDPRHRIDFEVARTLAARAAIPHLALEQFPDKVRLFNSLAHEVEYRHQLRLNSYSPHITELVPRYYAAFGQGKHIHVRSNLYEIGRASFQQRFPTRSPDTAREAALFYRAYAGKRVVPFGREIQAAFDEQFRRTNWTQALNFISAPDLYFWEHRMPTWLSNVMLESDCAFETMILLNSRNTIKRMVGVSVEERKADAIYEHIFQRLAPWLLDYPINPPTWPLEGEATVSSAP